MSASSDLDAFDERLRAMPQRTPRAARASLPPPLLAWLALAPMWPETVATRGFPVNATSMGSGPDVGALLDRLAKEGVLKSGNGEPPWRGRWYWMERGRRKLTIEQLLTDTTTGGVEFLRQELARIGRMLYDVPPRGYPPALSRFARLAGAADGASIGAVLDEEVRQALAVARGRKDTACPEAYRWIEAAEPLVRILGADITLALERAQRRLELFERKSRDQRFLDNYTERTRLEDAFEALLSDAADDSWALHYVGDGGMGKTMLVRRIASHFADKHRLVTSRIDFDHINPDYPSHAPGLLLIALAEDLKLNEDNTIAGLLRRFDETIDVAHRSVEAAQRSGTAIGTEVQRRLGEAERLFIEVLQTISRYSRVVLILDTCEELARLRPDGKLPDSVARTFELLERLHAAVRSLRVVFSGRRPLAASGYEWSSGEPGEHREFLRRAVVGGFDKDECGRFFLGYGQGQRPVDRRYWDRIRELSEVEPHPAPAEPASKGSSARQRADPRFNPYDLDLYAAWVTSETIDPDTLRKAGANYYARERIVLRVGTQIRRWLPHLARVRIFDLDLLQRLGTAAVDEYAAVAHEITAQEWVDLARGAQWAESEPDRQPPATWRVDPNIARRLERYYLDEEPEAWADAQRDLRKVLPALVIGRPWRELTPEYVVVATELQVAEPEVLLAWWSELERKIFGGRRWKWGREIVERLRDRAWPDFLSAALHATEAAIATKTGTDGRRLQELWLAADAALKGVTDSPHVVRLRYRARAGSVGALRWTAAPLAEDEVASELETKLAVVPPPPLFFKGDGIDPEIAATEIGLIDNTIETLERIEWRAVAPHSIVQPLVERSKALAAHLSAAGRAFVDARRARLQQLGGTVDTSLLANFAESGAEMTDRDFIDWSPPQDLRARIALEGFRLFRFRGVNRDARVDPPVAEPTTLDHDRMQSAWLLWTSDNLLPSDLDDNVIEASLALNTSAKPQCAAHRDVPPYFQVALVVRADRGRAGEVLELCNEIAEDSTRPLDVRRAAERAKVYVAARWRLRESDVARQTSLETSTQVEDLVQVAGAAAYDPKSADYAGRWNPVLERLAGANLRPATSRTAIERWHSWLDDVERGATKDESGLPPFDLMSPKRSSAEYEALLASPYGMAAELRSWALGFRTELRLPCGDRLAARTALEEGGLLAMRRPDAAMRLLECAAARFKACDDPIGSLLTAATSVVCLASTSDARLVNAQRTLAEHQSDCIERGLLSRTLLDRIDPATPDASSTISADASIDVWKPWAKRLAAVQERTRTDTPRRWEAAFPPDMRWLRATSLPPPPQARATGVSPLRWLALLGGLAAAAGALAALFVSWLNAPVTAFFDRLVREYPLRDDAQAITTAVLVIGGAGLAWLALTFRNDGATRLAQLFRAVGNGIATTLGLLLGLVLAIGGLFWLYQGFDWVLRFVGLDLHIGFKIGLLIVILGALGNIGSIYRTTIQGIEKLFRVKYVLVPAAEGGETGRSRLSVRTIFEKTEWTIAGAPPYVVPAADDITPYGGRTATLPARDDRFLPRAARVFGGLHMAANVEVIVPAGDAGTPWEALIGAQLAPGKHFADVGLRFRRTSEADTRALAAERFGATPMPPFPVERPDHERFTSTTAPPYPGSHLLVKLDARTIDPVLLRDQWQRKGGLDPKYFAMRWDDTEIAEQVLRPAVGILHVLDEILDTERGLVLRLRGETQLFATEVARRYPNLRLVLLQLPWRPDFRRFDHDRLEAARARQFAALLHEAGVPAVLVLPSMPEAIGLGALKAIVEVVAQRPERAMLPLTYAVHAATMTIAAAIAKDLAPDKADATAATPVPDADRIALSASELPFDVCFYCRSDLNLSIAPADVARQTKQEVQH